MGKVEGRLERIKMFGMNIETQEAQAFIKEHAVHACETGITDNNQTLYVRCVTCNKLFMMTYDEAVRLGKEAQNG